MDLSEHAGWKTDIFSILEHQRGSYLSLQHVHLPNQLLRDHRRRNSTSDAYRQQSYWIRRPTGGLSHHLLSYHLPRADEEKSLLFQVDSLSNLLFLRRTPRLVASGSADGLVRFHDPRAGLKTEQSFSAHLGGLTGLETAGWNVMTMGYTVKFVLFLSLSSSLLPFELKLIDLFFLPQARSPSPGSHGQRLRRSNLPTSSSSFVRSRTSLRARSS